ncbi:MAG: M14 family metallopeptidase [Chloroflexota bacterium]
MVDIQFNRHYRYDELTQLLNTFADEFPNLVKVESIGKSYEGRQVWVATVTNFTSGLPEDKAALWVDGNLHATELAATTACLYLLNKLTSEYGQNDEITRALDTRTFYICPRVSPDGTEWALADHPKLIRSSTRPYPFTDDPLPIGFTNQDVDGDGRMLMMRYQDEHGQWKKHDQDARLMVRRDPTEVGGNYYRVLPEGTLENFDGSTIQTKEIKENLDFNRNFPTEWRQEHEQQGAGTYPTSEPEVRNIVDFVVSHTNICGALSYHTWSGVLLRPFNTKTDDDMPLEDLMTYKKIGKKGKNITGYPHISVFHDFKYHPKATVTGASHMWFYDHCGIFAWIVEIWSPRHQAGITDYKYIEWYQEHPVEDDLKMLKWSDEKLHGKGYIGWYEFDHPQLGSVELGGWDMMHCWRNPPPHLLEQEVAPFSDWMIWYALIFPQLEIHQVNCIPLEGHTYKVQMVIQNIGWLPSYVTKQALNNKVIRGVIAEIELPDGASLKMGKQREILSQIEGRNNTASTAIPWTISATTSDRLKVEWIVYAPQNGTIKLIARHDRAGKTTTEVKL